jgi:hypothetical protein
MMGQAGAALAAAAAPGFNAFQPEDDPELVNLLRKLLGAGPLG